MVCRTKIKERFREDVMLFVVYNEPKRTAKTLQSHLECLHSSMKNEDISLAEKSLKKLAKLNFFSNYPPMQDQLHYSLKLLSKHFYPFNLIQELLSFSFENFSLLTPKIQNTLNLYIDYSLITFSAFFKRNFFPKLWSKKRFILNNNLFNS
jgi:hypothetical protein